MYVKVPEFSMHENETPNNFKNFSKKVNNYFKQINSGRKNLVKAKFISKGTSETKSEGTKDLVFANSRIFGRNGGTCKCGNTLYYVADERNNCESLACYGGEAGQCHVQKIYRWANII